MYIEPDSPAAKAGLQPQDQIISMGKEGGQITSVNSVQALPQVTKELAGQPVTIALKRAGKPLEIHAMLRTSQDVEASKKTDNPKGYLGIVPTEYVVRRSTWSAPVVAVGVTAQFTGLTYKGLATAIGELFRGHTHEASSQVSGPVGIFVLLKNGSLLGYQFVLMIIAAISLTLAIMNILPIPALDGGKLFVTLLFRAVRKPLTPRRENWIHGTGFALLMFLFIVITVVDVKRFF